MISLVFIMIRLSIIVLVWSIRLTVLFVRVAIQALVAAAVLVAALVQRRRAARRSRIVPLQHAPAVRQVSAPAAWFPDPKVAGQLRYWDGSSWTQYTHSAWQIEGPRDVQASPPYTSRI